jgi:YgiT-type zinc finger domain-containing protein
LNYKEDNNLYPLCGGIKVQGLTTYSVDIGAGVIVIRNVKSSIYEQCGEEWIDNNTSTNQEKKASMENKFHFINKAITFGKILYERKNK